MFILGGSGFIGSAVVRKLTQSGVRVRMLVHRRPAPEGNNHVAKIQGNMSGFEWKCLRDDPPDVIIHMARISGKTGSGRYLAGLKGYLANRRMIMQLSSFDKPPLVIYTSGTLVYGSCGTEPVDEDSPLNPVGFQRGYIRAEYPFLRELRSGVLPVSIVRLPWVYGPGSWFRQFYYSLIRARGVVPRYGSGRNMMSLIHLDDCASQIIEVARRGNAGSVYNLYTGEAVTHDFFCRMLSGITGSDIDAMQELELRRKFGTTVCEALTFSVNLTSRHSLIKKFRPAFADHDTGLRHVLEELHMMENQYT